MVRLYSQDEKRKGMQMNQLQYGGERSFFLHLGEGQGHEIIEGPRKWPSLSVASSERIKNFSLSFGKVAWNTTGAALLLVGAIIYDPYQVMLGLGMVFCPYR